MDTPAVRLPAHEIVYRRLRDMILYGELAPGQAVTIQGLAAAAGAGMTPVREAIRRLCAEGALGMQGNRRVAVPVLGARELDEVGFARLALEPRLAELAAPCLSAGEVDALAAIDATLDDAILRGDVGDYMRQNHRFHLFLYRQAGAPILLALAEALWLRSGPAARVVCGRVGTANLPDRHEEALAALRAGDATATARAIADDIRQGLGLIRAEMAASEI